MAGGRLFFTLFHPARVAGQTSSGGLYEHFAGRQQGRVRHIRSSWPKRRFDETRDEREAILATREETGVAVNDSVEQLEARAERLVELGETPLEAVVNVALSDIPNRKAAYERIIGETNDLRSWSFLPRGARAAASVARITALEAGRELPLGTGLLVDGLAGLRYKAGGSSSGRRPCPGRLRRAELTSPWPMFAQTRCS